MHNSHSYAPTTSSGKPSLITSATPSTSNKQPATGSSSPPDALHMSKEYPKNTNSSSLIQAATSPSLGKRPFTSTQTSNGPANANLASAAILADDTSSNYSYSAVGGDKRRKRGNEYDPWLQQ